MRSVLIGAVEGTDVALLAMQQAGFPPSILATLDPVKGAERHVDYVNLAPLCTKDTEVQYIENSNDPTFVEEIIKLSPDVIFVIGWSQLIGPELRSAARLFCVGFHPTPLPRLRGRAAIAWTIISGVQDSGTSLFVIDDGVDTGPILAQDRFPIAQDETAASLIKKNKQSLGRTMAEILPQLASGTARAHPQLEEHVSYGAGRKPEDAQIDWKKSAEVIERLIRAQGPPYSGAFTYTLKRKVRIWNATQLEPNARFFGAIGQIMYYDDKRPVVLCGNDTLLRLDSYLAEGREPDFVFSGQLRFRDTPPEPIR